MAKDTRNDDYFRGQLELAECILKMLNLILPNEADLPPFTVPQIETAKIHDVRAFLIDVVDNCEAELLPFIPWSETDDGDIGRHTATGEQTHLET